jgi:hypothetical protein
MLHLQNALSRLWSECWLGHQPRVHERDKYGRLVLVCPRCRHERVIHIDDPDTKGHHEHDPMRRSVA